MALFPQQALNEGVRKREVFGWAMYDFANSGYTTVVITAVFAAYFVGGIAQKAAWATFAWTAALSISYAIVMFTMPSLGAYADLRAAKKKLLVLTTVACVVSTAALALAGPGSVALAMLLVIVSNTFYSYGESLTAAFLPELARPDSLGKVSGWGWGFGYFGGMLALGVPKIPMPAGSPAVPGKGSICKLNGYTFAKWGDGFKAGTRIASRWPGSISGKP